MSNQGVNRRSNSANRRSNLNSNKWANEFAHNPYIGSFHRRQKITNWTSRTRSLLPSSSPHVGTFRHSPQTTSQGLKELLWEENSLTMPFISQIQLAQQNKYAKRHIAKKALDEIPSTRFAAADSNHADAPICAICLESFVDGDELRTLNCGHCFHRGCVDIWLLGTLSEESLVTSNCPTCRRDLSSSSSTVLVNISDIGASGIDVVTPSDDSSSSSEDIPRECFLRIGQFLFEQGNLRDDTERSPSEDSPSISAHDLDLPSITMSSAHTCEE